MTIILDLLKPVTPTSINRLGTALVAGVLAMGLLLGTSPAQAQAVDTDGDTVTAIRGLELGLFIYDVEFLTQSAASTYGGVFTTFDFDTSEEAYDAVAAVNSVLNAEGFLKVGESASGAASEFNVGFRKETVSIGDPTGFFEEFGFEFDIVVVRYGRVEPGLGVWVRDDNLYTFLDSTVTWADFTIVGFAGIGNLPPVADADGPYAGAVGAAVDFDGSGSSDPDGTIATYDWDFGDGTTAPDAGPTPSHTYSTADIYNVTLTVTDDSGAPASDSTAAVIGEVSEPPVADANGPYEGTVNAPVTFDGTGSSDPDGAIATYDWDFGDGTTAPDAGPTPSHTYSSADVYPVTLTVTDMGSASGTVQVFVTSQSYRGNLDGLAGADGLCTSAADAAGLGGDWTAWLSDSGTNARDRILDAEYQLLDGTVIATSLADLTDGALIAPINVDENSAPVSGNPWTGTLTDGTAGADTCSDWTDDTNASHGVQGDTDLETAGWTQLGSAAPCDFLRRLYCFADVMLPAENDGATDSDTTIATISAGNQPPVADAGAPVQGVVGVEVSFDGGGSGDPDGIIATYDWDFGDGNTAPDAGPTPSHTYSAADHYTVTLTVTDNDDAKDSSVTVAAIDASNQPPVADADGPYTGSVGAAVDFDGSGSSDPDGTIATYDWDFGDGNTAPDAGPTPSHTYSAADNYTVTLTVTDDDGETAMDFSTAAIDSPNQPPVADADGPYAGTVDVPVIFNGTGSSDPDGFIVSLDWSFGDGNSGSGEIPSHTYTEPGTYFVILTATDNEEATDKSGTLVFIGSGNQPPVADADGPYAGAADAAVSFDGSGSSDPDGSIATYDWDFGDGDTGSGATTSHTYSEGGLYHVILTVTDDDNVPASDRTAAIIGSISQPPVADADGPYVGSVGAAVSFDGSGSSDPDGTIATYDWDFGDGTTAPDAGPTPSHTYGASDNYVVKLTVTDDDGETALDITTALIGRGNLPPLADADGPYTGTIGVAVDFDGSGSGDLGGSIVSYDWDFGDGTTVTDAGPTPSHVYRDGGKYNVTLTVTDDDGAPDSDATLATVTGQRVDVDIKPGSDPNSINPQSRGVLPVAVLTTEDFDASTIDAESVRFGRGLAEEKHGRGHVEDVDGDGDMDLVLHFATQDTGIAPRDTEACLVGQTFDEVPVVGCDSVRTVPPGPRGNRSADRERPSRRSRR